MLTVYGVTHAGKRDRNEDAFFVDADLGLFVVADGMGGHNAGEVASQMAVDIVKMFVARSREGEDVTWPFGFNSSLSLPCNRVATAVQMANRRVLKASESHDEYTGMGTTIVVLLIAGDEVITGSVGDSRIYSFNAGQLTQLTHDDSWIETVAASDPLVDREKLATHPMRHVLTQVIGARDQVDVHTSQRPIEPGEQFLMCTDGLHGALDAATIAAVIAASSDVERGAQQLVDAALHTGGSDNITAVLLAPGHKKYA